MNSQLISYLLLLHNTARLVSHFELQMAFVIFHKHLVDMFYVIPTFSGVCPTCLSEGWFLPCRIATVTRHDLITPYQK